MMLILRVVFLDNLYIYEHGMGVLLDYAPPGPPRVLRRKTTRRIIKTVPDQITRVSLFSCGGLSTNRQPTRVVEDEEIPLLFDVEGIVQKLTNKVF